MLTPDTMIDRRILHEAETLYKQGHELILLANGSDPKNRFEWIGSIKVERMTQDQAIQRSWLGRKLFVNANKVIIKNPSEREIHVKPRIKEIQRRIWLFIQLFLAKFACRTLSLHVKIYDRVSLTKQWEHALIDRIEYYDPDIIHVHDLPFLKVGIMGKNKLHVPVIYDAHELYPEIHTLTAKQKTSLSKLERHYINKCEHVITVNQFIAEEMSKRYAIAVPTVIWNAVIPPEAFDPNQNYDRFRKSLKISADKKILLYQGWIADGRGLKKLISAMPLVSNQVNLVVMGYGEFREELEKMVSELDLIKRVFFKSAVTQNELLYWTASADAGIIPYPSGNDINQYYSSPNKLFEFIQAEIPIIANDLPFLNKVIAGDRFGIVAELNESTDFSKVINRLFDPSSGKLESYKKNLKSKKHLYSWDIQQKNLLNIYSCVLKPKN